MNAQLTLIDSLADLPKNFRKDKFKSFGESFVYNGEEEVILFLGADKKRITEEDIRFLGGKARNEAEENFIENLAVNFNSLMDMSSEFTEKEVAVNFLEGWYLAGYRFDKYKQDKKKYDSQLSLPDESYERHRQTAMMRAEAVNIARDLCNEPANKLTPQIYSEKLDAIFKDSKVEIEIIEAADLRQAGFHAVHLVGKGSGNSPKVAILKFNNGEGSPVALIGKGVTFDSGGTNTKTGGDIAEMKMDMGGSAAVVGAVKLLADLDCPVNLVAIIPLVVNVAGGEAYLPSDVITYQNGKTVEVGNTDAEGRLILADSILYAQAIGAENIIDIATLTGSIGHALGLKVAGVFCSDENRLWELKTLGEKSGDYIWPMPLVEDYQSLLESDTADLNNMSSSAFGGAITAALFLKNFVGERCKWIHIDMANTVRPWKKEGYYGSGASGFGVRLLAEIVQQERK